MANINCDIKNRTTYDTNHLSLGARGLIVQAAKYAATGVQVIVLDPWTNNPFALEFFLIKGFEEETAANHERQSVRLV